MAEALFPFEILRHLATDATSPILSKKVEENMHKLVMHLVSLKSQSRLIHRSVVAVPDQHPSSPTVRVRDACAAIRSFSGIDIPDVTALTRLPTVSMPEQSIISSPGSLIVNEEEAAVGVKGSGSFVARKKLVGQIPTAKPVKKRGRPRKEDKAIVAS